MVLARSDSPRRRPTALIVEACWYWTASRLEDGAARARHPALGSAGRGIAAEQTDPEEDRRAHHQDGGGHHGHHHSSAHPSTVPTTVRGRRRAGTIRRRPRGSVLCGHDAPSAPDARPAQRPCRADRGAGGHPVGLRHRGTAGRRRRGRPAGARPVRGDPLGQRRAGQNRPRPADQGAAGRAPRHRADRRQCPVPPRRRHPARVRHHRHEVRRRDAAAPGRHRARPRHAT